MNKLALTACIAASAAAPLTYASDLNINGFLSVGASMLDNDKVTLDGFDNNGGFKNDTVLGLQLSKKVNDSTTVTGQLVSRGSGGDTTQNLHGPILTLPRPMILT